MNGKNERLQAIVVRVLGIGKRTAPDRFPRYEVAPGQLDHELVRDWAEVIRVVSYPLTPEEELELWEEAVRLWVREAEHDRMVTAGDVLRAARRVWGRWNERPDLKALFDDRREQIVQQRDRQLAEGTFGQVRGYRPRAVESRPEVPERVEAMIGQMRAGRSWTV